MSVFFGNVEMIEHSAHNDPTVKAHANVPNGYFHIISSGSSAVPTASGELWVAINTPLGDDRYLADVTIKQGDRLNSYRVKDWDGKELIVTQANVYDAISGLSVGCFFALHPARSVYLQAHSGQAPSFAGHIAACLLLCWGILLSFGLLTGAAGLLIRGAFPGFLLVAAMVTAWLFSVRLCRPEPALWQWLLIWNPANVLLTVEDEKLMFWISRWFLGSDPTFPLAGLEPELVCSWVLFGAGLFFAAWRGFLKKEM